MPTHRRRALVSAVRNVISRLFPDLARRNAPIESLEPRQLLSIAFPSYPSSVVGTSSADYFYLRSDPLNTSYVQLFKSTTAFTTAPADDADPYYESPRVDVTYLKIYAFDGDDTLTIDLRCRIPLHDDVLIFNGGTGTDTLSIVDDNTYTAALLPTDTGGPAGSGDFELYQQYASYTGLENVTATGLTAFTLSNHAPFDDPYDDSIALSHDTSNNLISGTLGSCTLPSISFNNTPKLVVDFENYDTLSTQSLTSAGLLSDDSPVVQLKSFSDTPTSATFTAGTTRLWGSSTTASLSLSGSAVATLVGESHLSSISLADSSTLNLTHTNTTASLADSLTMAGTSVLDLQGHSFFVPYTTTSPYSTLDAYILNNVSNITTAPRILSTPDLRSNHYQIYPMLFDNNDAHFHTMDGMPTAPLTNYNQVIVRPSYLGDSNLDGKVDATDYAAVDGNMGSGTTWPRGDLDFSGLTSPADYAQIDGHMSAGTSNSTASFSPISDTVGAGEDYTIDIPTDSNTPASYEVNWGDGTVNDIPASGPGLDLHPTHSYASGGNPTIVLTTIQTDGSLTYSGVVHLTVNDTATLEVYSLSDPGNASTYTLGIDYTATDEVLSLLSIVWGDGTTDLVPGDTEQMTHTWSSAPTPDHTILIGGSHAALTTGFPAAPTGVSASSNNGHSIDVSWSDNSSIEYGYLVEYALTDSANDDDWTAEFAAADATSLTLTGPFAPSTEYYIRVSAYTDLDTVKSTTYGPITTDAFPESPTDFAISSATTSALHLSWTSPTATTLTLQRTTDGVTWTTLSSTLDPSTDTSYDDTSLSSDTRYFYRLFAVNGTGDSGYATAALATLPSTPTGLTAATYSAQCILLDWSDVSGPDLAGYNIYRDTSSSFTPGEDNLVDNSTTSDYSDFNADPDTTYYYKIAAVNGDDGLSSFTSAASATTLVAPSITGSSSVDEGSTYTLTLHNNSNPISSWQIYWGEGDVQSLAGSATTATHTWNGVVRDRTVDAWPVDDSGVYDLSLGVIINNVAPSITISGSNSIDEGSSYTLNLNSSDPGDNTIASASIDWGDGITESYDGDPATLTHVYQHEGSYSVTATVTDIDGLTSATSSAKSVTVNNTMPIIAFTDSVHFHQTDQYYVYVDYSDGDADPVDVTIDWGDGTTPDTAEITGPTTFSHGYAPGDPTDDVTIAASATTGGTTYNYPDLPTFSPTRINRYYVITASGGPWDYLATVSNDTISTSSGDYTLASSPINAVIAGLAGSADFYFANSPPVLDFTAVYPAPSGATYSWDLSTSFDPDTGFAEATLTLNHDDQPEDWPYAARWIAEAVPVTVSISAVDTAIEGGTYSSGYEPGFWVTRDLYNSNSPELDVQLRITGDAAPGDDYEAIPSTVTIPEGEGSVFVPLNVVDDSDPEWTENVVARIMPGYYKIASSADSAISRIVDNDLSILLYAPTESGQKYILTNSDDDNNDNVQDFYQTRASASEDDLYALDLHYPDYVPAGATVTLTIDNPYVNVWTTPTKGTRLLGGSVLTAPLDGSLHTVYVEGIRAADADTFLLAGNQGSTTRPTTGQATEVAAANQRAPEVVPKYVDFHLYKPFNKVEADFVIGWQLHNHPDGEAGQIVQHVIIGKEWWAKGKIEGKDQATIKESLRDYWEAWTVTANGAIKVKAQNGGEWRDDNSDHFQVGLGGNSQDNYSGFINFDGTFKYAAGTMVPEERHEDAAGDLWSTHDKPTGWDADPKPKSGHYLHYHFTRVDAQADRQLNSAKYAPEP